MKAIIITDGTESIQSVALLIKETIAGYKTDIYPAQDFAGNELLAADLFFIGCEKASPVSFNFIEQMLSHINLASRKCGIFSVNEKSIKYLLKILKDSEANVGVPFLAQVSDQDSNEISIKKWLTELVYS